MKIIRSLYFLLVTSLCLAPASQSQTPTSASVASPPQAQTYIATQSGPARLAFGRLMVPVSFFANGLGASVGPIDKKRWRLLYFNHTLDFYPYQTQISVNGKSQKLPTYPQVFGKELYVPFAAFADFLDLKWSLAPGYNGKTDKGKTVFLVQFRAAKIESVRSSADNDKVRTVVTLSNATPITAIQNPQDASFLFAGARENGVEAIDEIGDFLVPRTLLYSGNWRAKFAVRLNYRAPIRWFTLGNPARLVIDSQRLFEEQTTQTTGGLQVTKIRRGTGHGPVQMYLAKLDPRQGWRIRIAPGGATVLKRARPSKLARRNKAILAINGGFFAYDGAAVGAMLVRGQWMRLPWNGRTALGFTSKGRAHIDNLQTHAYVDFSGGKRLPIRDLNGWPDRNRITVLTHSFGKYYKLRRAETALVVSKGKVTSTLAQGDLNIPAQGFALIANGGARPILKGITRGQRAQMTIRPINWPRDLVTALGGGPRLVKNGQVFVPDEGFRTDVTVGTGPRTAFGVDKWGRYMLLVVDGRQGYHSTGLTLSELAATMQKFGAVNALNLDGGGSTAMAVGGKVINRPSDGVERAVSNALLVSR